MNFALLFAGGTGRRMQSAGTPKQFLKMYGKEIVAYTIDAFEKHSEIDGIVVVCLESYIPELERIVRRNRFEKVKTIIPGGSTGLLSIYEGLKYLHNNEEGYDIVLIHDGVRPIVSQEVISSNIRSVKVNGNAITVMRATETICLTENGLISEVLPRANCVIAKAPQSFYINDIYKTYKWACMNGFGDAVDSAELTRKMGKKLYFVPCDSSNIKITYPVDYYIMKGIFEAIENEQVIGLNTSRSTYI